MDRLIDGYHRFRAEAWLAQRARFEALAERGQRPHAMVIACSDSRVDPQLIFDAAPGELFVVRNVANLVPPYAPDAAYHGTSAALEFGVRVLGVSRVVVMGHGSCGGVQALLSGAPPVGAEDFVGPWMRLARPAREAVLACGAPDPQEACEHAVVRLSLQNLMTFPWVAEAVAAGRLRLQGLHFAIHSGVLAVLDPDSGRFAAASGEAGREG